MGILTNVLFRRLIVYVLSMLVLSLVFDAPHWASWFLPLIFAYLVFPEERKFTIGTSRQICIFVSPVEPNMDFVEEGDLWLNPNTKEHFRLTDGGWKDA